ncbi:hypothetical protein CYMTET_18420 [Cymbomonas tetramitiformis]|uniref:Uncharacterized protein n=1 Tax=Cymbomonas tetramitiformis TaxID=36881 RepID=A0AAE0L676_9CHLO|nr:hypothetical protein CYMTET_34969 [Cymbomonas tetramitiformis]KAK3273332.1 hypothetical protein CYMTET_18420 [Cymbomonas tetramitiformis]
MEASETLTASKGTPSEERFFDLNADPDEFLDGIVESEDLEMESAVASEHLVQGEVEEVSTSTLLGDEVHTPTVSLISRADEHPNLEGSSAT